MLIKNIKHDILSTYREFFGIYLALIVAAIIGPFIINSQNDGLYIFLFISVFGIVIATFVITFLTIVRLYHRRLFSAEGYLTLTLPVKTHIVLISKVLTGLFWMIVTTLVGVLSGAIFVGIYALMYKVFGMDDILQIMNYLTVIWNTGAVWTFIQSLIVTIPLSITDALYTLTLLLFVMIAVNTSFIKKGKLAIGIAAYMILDAILGAIMGLITMSPILFNLDEIMATGNLNALRFTVEMTAYGLNFAVTTLVVAALGFASWWLIDHKLELE